MLGKLMMLYLRFMEFFGWVRWCGWIRYGGVGKKGGWCVECGGLMVKDVIVLCWWFGFWVGVEWLMWWVVVLVYWVVILLIFCKVWLCKGLVLWL